MKKNRDMLGEVFKAIVMTACILCLLGAVFSVVGAIPRVKTENWVQGGIYLALSIGCLFAFWLVSTLSKISTKICDTESHLEKTVILLENISNKLETSKMPSTPHTPAENTEQ